MTKEQIIKLTEEWLNNFNDNKKRIKLIDTALKLDYDKATIEKLNQERRKLHRKLSRVINAISALDDKNQKIICYRYFDKMKYDDICLRVDLKDGAIRRRIKQNILVIARVMFGFEDEFWIELHDGFKVYI